MRTFLAGTSAALFGAGRMRHNATSQEPYR
jgi:hypothetical protein